MFADKMQVYDQQPYFGYTGDRGDWLMCISRTRDSDALEESNFDAAYKLLTEDRPDWAAQVAEWNETDNDVRDVAIERASHWLCGWTETILVKPGSEAERLAYDIRARLEDYPVLDEEDWSEREYEEVLGSLEAALDDHYRSHTLSPDTEELAGYLYREGGWEIDYCYPEFRLPVNLDRRKLVTMRDAQDIAENRKLLAKALRAWRNDKRHVSADTGHAWGHREG